MSTVQALEKNTLAALCHLNDLDQLIENFDASRTEHVQQKVQAISQALRTLDTSATDADELACPAQLLQWIDEGKDPDAFVKALFQETLHKHQVRQSTCSANTGTSLHTRDAAVSCRQSSLFLALTYVVKRAKVNRAESPVTHAAMHALHTVVGLIYLAFQSGI